MTKTARTKGDASLLRLSREVNAAKINFMATHARGLICSLPTDFEAEALGDQLNLPPQTNVNTTRFGTAFTVSIEARRGITTGISAADRAQTILTAIDPKITPDDLARPGHMFPLRAKNGGVLVRAGQTEGSVDLCRLAGLQAASVICEIMNTDGTMARLTQLEMFAATHKLKIVSIRDLIEYRRATEKLIERVAEVELPTRFGNFTLYCYQSAVGDSGVDTSSAGEHHLRIGDG